VIERNTAAVRVRVVQSPVVTKLCACILHRGQGRVKSGIHVLRRRSENGIGYFSIRWLFIVR